MSDFNTSKTDGNTVAAVEWNQLADIDNLVINSGQTPSSSNLDQLAIASARYSSGGQFFTDSGTANAYVLSPVASSGSTSFKSPVSATAGEGYFVGMVIRFRAGNANSGASTVNVNGAGVKNLKKADGTDVATGDILTTRDVAFRYNGTNFIKVENVNPATTTVEGIASLATQTEVNTGTDANKIVSPATLKNSNLSAPAFHITLSANQNIGNATITKVRVNTKVLDTNNYFDNTTNYRFTPLIAGWYFVSWGGQFSDALASAQGCSAYLYKNGAAVKAARSSYWDNQNEVINANHIVYMNGTTDYLEFYADIFGTNANTIVGNNDTYFMGFKLNI